MVLYERARGLLPTVFGFLDDGRRLNGVRELQRFTRQNRLRGLKS